LGYLRLSLQNKPLINAQPGETNSTPNFFEAGMAALFNANGLKTNKLLPARVMQYNRTTNIATVQPLVMLVDVNDNSRIRNQIASAPVLSLGGGGFHINFPLKDGDLGWILAADKDISTFLANLTPAPPNTLRKHRFEDSWFIPDVFRKYTINGADSANMVIQSTDGTTRISIGEGVVNITAPGSAAITTPTWTLNGNGVITGNLQVQQNLTVTGTTAVNGGFNATGGTGSEACTLPATTTIDGITVATHGHTSSTPGTRTSGGMIT
jgi:hypothetical protein